jgi:hypothetical protein
MLKPALRHAIAKNQGGYFGGPALRNLILEALATRGWSPERIEAEYARYVVECYESGKANEFASVAPVA